MPRINTQLIQSQIKAKFRLKDDILKNWPVEIARAPRRETLWRWLRDGPPMEKKTIFGLAGSLDVDPIALIEKDPEDYARLCARLMLAIRLPARLSRHVIKDWLWLDDLITPSAEWPPSQFSQSVYGRNWTFDGFRHAGSEGSEFYERIIIDSPRQDFDLPRIWHFASKHIAEPICEGAAFGNWVPYGFVERSGGFLRLFHLDGRNTSIPIAQDSTRFIVETRLGLVPADFRIASVHYFTMERTNEANLPFVRFK